MTIHLNEILRAASQAQIMLNPLPQDQQSQFWIELQSRFGLDLDVPLWNQIQFSINEVDPNGWQRLPSYFNRWPNLFFCDHYREVPIYQFECQEDLLSLLSESFHFVFYIASPDFEQLGVFDDHECLRYIGGVASCGSSASTQSLSIERQVCSRQISKL